MSTRRDPNSEDSYFCQPGEVPTRRGSIFVNPEGSEFGGVLFLSTRRGPNSEGFYFCQSRGAPIQRGPFLSIRRGLRNVFVYKHDCRDPKTYIDESKIHFE